MSYKHIIKSKNSIIDCFYTEKFSQNSHDLFKLNKDRYKKHATLIVNKNKNKSLIIKTYDIHNKLVSERPIIFKDRLNKQNIKFLLLSIIIFISVICSILFRAFHFFSTKLKVSNPKMWSIIILFGWLVVIGLLLYFFCFYFYDFEYFNWVYILLYAIIPILTVLNQIFGFDEKI